MRCKETVFGFPVWYGNVRARYIKSETNILRPTDRHIKMFNNDLKPGDLYNDCSGFNKVLKNILPEYTWLGSRRNGRKEVLYGFELEAENGGYCSFNHCGIEPPKSREEIETDMFSWLRESRESLTMNGWWTEHTEADYQKFLRGEHVCDDRGIKLK